MKPTTEKFFYSMNFETKKVRISDEKGVFIEEILFTPDCNIEMKYGILCDLLAEGLALQEITSKEGWRLSTIDFLKLSTSSEKYKRMLDRAKKIRLLKLEEELYSLKNAEEIKNHVSKVKAIKELNNCQEGIKTVESKEDQRPISVTWAQVEQLKKR